MGTGTQSKRRGERVADLARGRGSAEIGGPGSVAGQQGRNRLDDGRRRVGVAQMLQHHRARPDLGDGVGDAPPRDVGCRAVHRLEHRGVLLLRVDVARGGEADGAGDGGAEVGQNVAEQVGAHHHVEPVRMGDEMRRQDVDMVPVGLDTRILGGDGGETLVPVGHRMDDAVRLGGGRHLPGRSGAGELEGEAHDPVAAAPGEHGLLDRGLVLGAGVEPAADLGYKLAII